MERKVAVVLPRLYTGGVARVAVELVDRLEEIEGLEFIFFSNRVNMDWHKKLDSEVYKFSPYPYPELAYHRPDVKRKLESCDLIWNHNTYLNKLGRLLQTPMLSVNHTYHSFRRPKWAARKIPFKAKIQRKLAKTGAEEMQHVDRIVAISDAIQRRTEDMYKGRVVRIYHGGDSEWTKFSDKDKGYILAPDATSHTVRRISKSKDLKALGSGSEESIEWLGRLKDNELARVYRNCSFIVSDSYKDGFGLYVAEAAFCGKPAVVRNIGGIKEVVDHGKTGFVAKNSKEFHEYVNKLSENPNLREEMGRKAYERAKENFRWKVAAEKYLAEMNDLMRSEFSMKV